MIPFTAASQNIGSASYKVGNLYMKNANVYGVLTLVDGSTLTVPAASVLNISATPTFQQISLTYGIAAATGAFSSTLQSAGYSGTTGAFSSTLDVNGQVTFGVDNQVSTITAAGAATFNGAVTGASLSTGGTVTAAAVNVSGSGQVLLGNATSAALAALAPGQAKGALIANSTTGEICTSTGTAAGSWVLLKDITTACY